MRGPDYRLEILSEQAKHMVTNLHVIALVIVAAFSEQSVVHNTVNIKLI